MDEKLSKKETIPEYYSFNEAGILLGWDRRRVHTYTRRNLLPEPVATVGGRPLWTKEQLLKFEAEWRERISGRSNTK